MKKVKTARRITSVILAFVMAFVMLFGTTMTTFAAKKPIKLKYGTTEFTKISNPTSGPMDPDGLNTNDPKFDANRLNSYAWAVASRGDYIYIGTNRTLFGSALNATAELVKKQNSNINEEVLGKIAKVISGDEVPVLLPEKDYIPQIIRFDVNDGSSKVIYQPDTVEDNDGHLYYKDKDGNPVKTADVASETLSFRSVIEYNGNLYFGTLGVNMLRLVRVDEEDKATIPFETIGSYSSLRACCLYDNPLSEEPGQEEYRKTIFFGGQDATYKKWQTYRQEHLGGDIPLPIAIRYLDPKTAGTDKEDWSGLVADYDDFGEYAYASVYVTGGGNVWDLCSYNGKLYLILAYDDGWVMFRGEKGGKDPNEFGWTWTEIVGNNSEYRPAMDEEIRDLNDEYEFLYGCREYNPQALNGSGLLESTATPYVYNGKMYIGSFDNATALQAQTTTKLLTKFAALQQGKIGPTLTQIFAPFYEVLAHPQHIWVMDEKEIIKPVDSANELLEGTTTDYVWRFIEYNGKLYTGTFDSATAYNYYLDFTMDRVINVLREQRDKLPDYLKQLLDGKFSGKLQQAFTSGKLGLSLHADDDAKEAVDGLQDAAIKASTDAEAFFAGDKDVEDLLASMTALEDAEDDLQAATKSSGLKLNDADGSKLSAIQGKAREMIEFLQKLIDVEGLKYLAKARKLIRKDEAGFDIFVTEDGENWDRIVGDGLHDRFNYGARTFTICNDELYVGTANPYFGAQLWKITPDQYPPAKVVKKPRSAFPKYNGEAQELVKPGIAEGGTMEYAMGLLGDAEPNDVWSEDIPTAVEAGNYVVFWRVKGDEKHSDKFGGSVNVKLQKARTKITVEQPSKTIKEKRLAKEKRKFNIKASATSGVKLEYKVVSYKNRDSKKYLKFKVNKGKVVVKKGTPAGSYGLTVRIKAAATDNYYSQYKLQNIKVTVK